MLQPFSFLMLPCKDFFPQIVRDNFSVPGCTAFRARFGVTFLRMLSKKDKYDKRVLKNL